MAAVVDLFSRRVVGWSMSAAMAAQLVTDALVMAIWRRGKPDALMHHSDRGSQYTSEQFQRLMADHGVICSMSRSGNVWDNAAMESFFSSLKTERTARRTYRSRDEAEGGRVRLHRALLQPEAPALDDRISKPYGVRAQSRIRLSRCHPNRVQAISIKAAEQKIVAFAKRSPTGKVERSQLSLQDRAVYDSIVRTTLAPAQREKLFMEGLERLKNIVKAADLKFQAGKKDAVDSGGDIKAVGQTVGKMNLDKRTRFGLSVLSVIPETFPSDWVRQRGQTQKVVDKMPSAKSNGRQE